MAEETADIKGMLKNWFWHIGSETGAVARLNQFIHEIYREDGKPLARIDKAWQQIEEMNRFYHSMNFTYHPALSAVQNIIKVMRDRLEPDQGNRALQRTLGWEAEYLGEILELEGVLGGAAEFDSDGDIVWFGAEME